MDDIVKGMKSISLPSGKYWFPEESVGTKITAKEGKSQMAYGVPEISKMITKWRNEREDIMNKMQKQKNKSSLKKKNMMERKKKKDLEKCEKRRDLALALQNATKTGDDCNLLLAELENFEKESQHIRDSSSSNQDRLLGRGEDLVYNPFGIARDIKDDSLSLKKIFSNQSTVKFLNEDEAQKAREKQETSFVHEKLIEDVFFRLKKQQECDSESSLKLVSQEDSYFEESYIILKKLYEKEMKTLNIKEDTHSLNFILETFPPFPSTVKELDLLSNNPLIIFREWCHFHKLTPIPFDKMDSIECLINNYTSNIASDNIRLSSLCTLIHLYSDIYPDSAENQESEILLTCHDMQNTSTAHTDEISQALHKTLTSSHGKIQLGSALALALTRKSDDNRDVISSTLMKAVKGLTTVERRIAALAMAYAGIFEHSALHVLLEEWKSAEYPHTLQQYLIALRWLSFHEPLVIRSVAEFLSSRNLHFRLYVCLTLPFLEGNLSVSVKDALIHLMRNSSAYVLRLAAARVLECKQRGDCVLDYITMSMSSANILRALEVIQLSLMLKRIDPKIAGILLPCLSCDNKYVKTIGLNVIEKLRINTPKIVEAISHNVFDKDSEIREASLNTLRIIGAQGIQVEPLAFTALMNENNENVYTALLKLIGTIGIKGRILQKLLRKSFNKPHNKENQELISNLLENMESELEDISFNRSLPVLRTSGLEVTSEKSHISNIQNIFSLENAAGVQDVLQFLSNKSLNKSSDEMQLYAARRKKLNRVET